MSEPDPIGKIDIVLSIFQPSGWILEYGENKQLIRKKLLIEKQINVGDRLLDEILFKLEKDGYLRSETNCHVIRDGVAYYADPKMYKLTFEGELFLLSKGYNQKLIISAQNEKRIVRNEKWLLRGTWFAGFAGMFLLLWQIFVYFYPVHKDYPFWFWEKIPVEKHAKHS